MMDPEPIIHTETTTPITCPVPQPQHSDSGIHSLDSSPGSSSSSEPVPCCSKSLKRPASPFVVGHREYRMPKSVQQHILAQEQRILAEADNDRDDDDDDDDELDMYSPHIIRDDYEEDEETRELAEANRAYKEAEFRKLVDSVPFEQRATVTKENPDDLGEFKSHVIIDCPWCDTKCPDRQEFHKHISFHLKRQNKKFYMCERCIVPFFAPTANDYVDHVRQLHSHVSDAELFCHVFSTEQSNAQGKPKISTCKHQIFKYSGSKYSCPQPEKPKSTRSRATLAEKREADSSAENSLESDHDEQPGYTAELGSDPESSLAPPLDLESMAPLFQTHYSATDIKLFQRGISKGKKAKQAKRKQPKKGRQSKQRGNTNNTKTVKQPESPAHYGSDELEEGDESKEGALLDIPCLPDCYERKCKRIKCGEVFYTKSLFWDHAGHKHMHEKKIQHCPAGLCNFQTEFSHHMLYHLNNHTATKTWKCKRCPYSSVNKGMLMSHLKSHNPEKNFKCLDCTHETKFVHAFKKHLRENKSHKWTILKPDGSVNEVAVKNLDIWGNSRGSKHKLDDTNESDEPEEKMARLTPKTDQIENYPKPTTEGEPPATTPKPKRKTPARRKPSAKSTLIGPKDASTTPNIGNLSPVFNQIATATSPLLDTLNPSIQQITHPNRSAPHFHSVNQAPAHSTFLLPGVSPPLIMPITTRGIALAGFLYRFVQNPRMGENEWIRASNELRDDLHKLNQVVLTNNNNSPGTVMAPHLMEILHNGILRELLTRFTDFFIQYILPKAQVSPQPDPPATSMKHSPHNSPAVSKPKNPRRRKVKTTVATPTTVSDSLKPQNTFSTFPPNFHPQLPFTPSPSPPNKDTYSPRSPRKSLENEAIRPSSFMQSPSASPSSDSISAQNDPMHSSAPGNDSMNASAPNNSLNTQDVPMDLSIPKRTDNDKTPERTVHSAVENNLARTNGRNKRKKLTPIKREHPERWRLFDEIIDKKPNHNTSDSNNNAGLPFNEDRNAGEGPIAAQCKYCKLKFNNELLHIFDAHMRLHSEENPLHCKCTAQFTNFEDFSDHSIICPLYSNFISDQVYESDTSISRHS